MAYNVNRKSLPSPKCMAGDFATIRTDSAQFLIKAHLAVPQAELGTFSSGRTMNASAGLASLARKWVHTQRWASAESECSGAPFFGCFLCLRLFFTASDAQSAAAAGLREQKA